ncbi:type II restriction enzyme [Clostridium saccharoperbutylacetonicum]|uniref:Type-2 restriction enzyme n=1 Tax=Clostridium saccharoperbutylacetonicum N1-4(HMT) TaxID=931276 RepID=M1LX50_9CLOT|nr:type II restriction endonuclease [Clostridium saccharoperbutylacetonicum]AGF57805.1 type-2 restriction enzyme DpnII [Clostridium saccharoperbutylacetonicum N1-4(HMT)]NRT61425.1 type II restriction enzyme [Clostridium saccharoperbutylacetonicum]NSB24744.1 type II restriction enzyme [Clostridium saccharoperbutylacetonicum]NSB44117.1 type II restriction enzyme [Clostridium saccharoperbutylacetonicum]
MKRNFDKWLETFRSSIADYEYYVNFKKVFQNVDNIKVELNILNSLIGSSDIENDFENLMERYPETLKCIPILLAVRNNEILAMDEDGSFVYDFRKKNQTIEQYKIFMKKTGLFDLLANHGITNLIDYVVGVETGLDSNGRKNRGGHLMEDLVEGYIQKEGITDYYKEMYLSDVEKKWDIDLSQLSNDGKTAKRFDFVVKTPSMIYGIETNFYASSGSKLNETARSYKMLAEESKEIQGFTFVWLTDGLGWQSAKRNLEETFDVLDTIYNIKDLEIGIMREVFK